MDNRMFSLHKSRFLQPAACAGSRDSEAITVIMHVSPYHANRQRDESLADANRLRISARRNRALTWANSSAARNLAEDESKMPAGADKPIIFISYAHADEPEKPAEGQISWTDCCCARWIANFAESAYQPSAGTSC
jgi:hypothetical protein